MPKKTIEPKPTSVATQSCWPKYYDIHTDELRAVTQKDVDTLMLIMQAWGKLSRQIKSPIFEQINVDLRNAIKALENK